MALGHWAKTYLNPNGGGTELPSVTASDNGKVLGVDGGEYKLVEQSKGVEVEFVKLMETNVSLSDNGHGGGGGGFVDNKTYGELIGSKKVIGFHAKTADTTSAIYAMMFLKPNSLSENLDMIIDQNNESIRAISAIGFSAVGSNSYSGAVTIYAICI